MKSNRLSDKAANYNSKADYWCHFCANELSRDSLLYEKIFPVEISAGTVFPGFSTTLQFSNIWDFKYIVNNLQMLLEPRYIAKLGRAVEFEGIGNHSYQFRGVCFIQSCKIRIGEKLRLKHNALLILDWKFVNERRKRLLTTLLSISYWGYSFKVWETKMYFFKSNVDSGFVTGPLSGDQKK